MKKTNPFGFILIFMVVTTFAFSQNPNNNNNNNGSRSPLVSNSFDFDNDFGQLKVRNFASGNLLYKTAIEIDGNNDQLLINNGSVFSGGLILGSNVGIGITPSSKLDVFGRIKLSEAANEWLYSDGSVRIDIDNDFNQSDRIFVVSKDNGSNELLRVQENGNVGIGAANPSSRLQIMDQNNGLSLDVSNDLLGLGFNRSVKTGEIYDTTKSGWQFTARDSRFSLEGYNGADSNLLNILKNGNVGIGTRTPSAKLESVSPDGNLSSLRLGRLDNSNYWDVNHAGNDFRLYNLANSGSNIIFGVDPGGNVKNNYVGIGIPNPTANLEVLRDEPDSGNILNLRNKNPGAGAYTEIALGNDTSPEASTLGIASSSNSTIANNLFLYNRLNGDIMLGTNNIERLRIKNNGNVGIGAINPNERLHVNGNIKLHQNGNKIYWDWPDRCIEQYSSGGSNKMIRFKNSMDTSNPDGGFDFTDNSGNTVLRINKNMVAIGTNDFSGLPHKFRVEGSIGAREVRIQSTGWSDFVFENDYKLPSLAEVEKHINNKGHLKDIPSAEEVLKNGFYLGQMDAKLLQKIEELTLYTIQQEKMLQVQANQLESQENKMEEQSKQLEKLKVLVEKLLEVKN